MILAALNRLLSRAQDSIQSNEGSTQKYASAEDQALCELTVEVSSLRRDVEMLRSYLRSRPICVSRT